MTKLMKGHVFSEHSHKITYPVYVEPKVDEVRCQVTVNAGQVQFLSYADKPLHNLKKYAEIFHDLTLYFDIQTFDVGIEVNGNFKDSLRFVRSSKGIPDDLQEAPVTFWLYDLPDMEDQTYQQRRTKVQDVVERVISLGNSEVRVLDNRLARNEVEVIEMYNVYRALGYEGVMVKNGNGMYHVGKRHMDWLKLKPSNDADGVITELHEGVSALGTPLGRVASVTLKMEDGSTATAHGIPHDLGFRMFGNPQAYIGRWAELKYMERFLDTGGYRHPVFVRLREDKA